MTKSLTKKKIRLRKQVSTDNRNLAIKEMALTITSTGRHKEI